MKRLIIIRHAKSSWDDESLSDFDRPLNERGKRDAPVMGSRLKERQIVPDLMISSGAKRARSTCKRIAEEIGYDTKAIVVDDRLYHAGEQGILEVIKKVNDKNNTIMIFGHNPGLTEFVNEFADGDPVTGNIPTCGVVAFEVEAPSWKEVNFQAGRLLFFDYPKKEN